VTVAARASAWTRLSDRANAAVWALPAPRRVKALLSRGVYRNPPMPVDRVLELLDALERAEVELILMGGWGIDALVGHQRRVHRDLDLIVARRHVEAAIGTLRRMGFEEWFRDCSPARLAAHRVEGDIVVMRDSAMRVVELHPIRLRDGAGPEAVRGSIGGHPVRCISAQLQVDAHSRFRKRLPGDRRRQEENLATARQVLGRAHPG